MRPPLSALAGRAGIFLLLLIAADAAFVVLHLVHKFSPLLRDAVYSVEVDGGYAEVFQYLKLYWIAVLLFVLWQRTRESLYAAWALLFAYLLCDDAFQLHERGGAAIALHLGFDRWLGMRAIEIGELMISGAVALALLASILLLYRRGSRAARDASKDLAVLMAVLAFFGVFVDTLHAVFGRGLLEVVLGLVEDGGEMLAVSLLCWYALLLVERRDTAAGSLRHHAGNALGAVAAAAASAPAEPAGVPTMIKGIR